MGKKIFTLLSIVFIVSSIFVGSYFIYGASKDDTKEIQRVIALEYPEFAVAHIELLEENSAIAFYDLGHDNQSSFGNIFLEKRFKGWKIVLGGSLYLLDDTKLNWGHLDVSNNSSVYTDLLRGKITDPEIERVQVITTQGKKHHAKVVNYNINEKFWFLLTNSEDILGAIVAGMSSDGEVIEEIIINDF